jgi:signal transduction histidine kinase
VCSSDLFESDEVIAEKYAHVRHKNDTLIADITILLQNNTPVTLMCIASPLYNQQGEVVGAIESVRDITERRLAEEALAATNNKLKLLSGITRNDITSQVSIIKGYLTGLERKQSDTLSSEYFKKINSSVQRILSMIQFTREYEEIGGNAPLWHDFCTLIDTAAQQVPSGNLQVKNEVPAGLEVFADPLMTRVFYNLMDNAVRYGGKITTIRFFAANRERELIIVCEDDGAGVPYADKKKIFEQGYGKNAGLGLFLTREILSVTGITITETGEPGKGARFELAIPEGIYRSVDVK